MSRGKKLWWLNVGFLVGSILVWVGATIFGWLESVAFVSHISLAALVMSAVAGMAGADAAVEAETDG